jgi:HEAT repeat protein
MGPPAKEAVPMLIAALEDPDWSVRRSAARALGQIGPEAAPAVPALMQLLKSPDAEQGGPGVVRPSAGI